MCHITFRLLKLFNASYALKCSPLNVRTHSRNTIKIYSYMMIIPDTFYSATCFTNTNFWISASGRRVSGSWTEPVSMTYQITIFLNYFGKVTIRFRLVFGHFSESHWIPSRNALQLSRLDIETLNGNNFLCKLNCSPLSTDCPGSQII